VTQQLSVGHAGGYIANVGSIGLSGPTAAHTGSGGPTAAETGSCGPTAARYKYEDGSLMRHACIHNINGFRACLVLVSFSV